MVVCAGETLTAVPLVTLIFPGVITPVPFEKTPVRLAIPPALTAVGLAAKLVIVGSAGLCHAVNELHPVRTAKKRLKTETRKKVVVTQFIASPVIEATRERSVFQEPGRISWFLFNYLLPYCTDKSIPVLDSEKQDQCRLCGKVLA